METWKKAVRAAGFNPNKELAFVLCLALPFIGAIVGLYIALGSSYYLILPVMGYLLTAYVYLGRFQRMLDQKDKELTLEFVRLFTFFGVYIQDGFNVFQALSAIARFASPEMGKRLETLMEGIENDPTVQPFVDFASGFRDIAIKQVMLSIYQMIDEGQGGVYIRQFERLFGNLSEQKHRDENEKWSERLKTLSFLPLVGGAIAMVALSLSLVNVMEEMLHVL